MKKQIPPETTPRPARTIRTREPEPASKPTPRQIKKPFVIPESRVRTEHKPDQPTKTVRKIVLHEPRKQPVRKVTPRRSGGFGNMSAYEKATKD